MRCGPQREHWYNNHNNHNIALCPQVEERLRFYEDGVAPTKNLTAMQDALRTVAETAAAAAPVGEDAVDPEEGVDAEARAVAAQPKKGKVRRQLLPSRTGFHAAL